MSRLEQTQKLIKDSSLMNPDEEHHEYQHSDEEHNNILMFILGTQQHSDGQNVHPSSKSLWGPGHVAQHHWSPYRGYMSPKTL